MTILDSIIITMVCPVVKTIFGDRQSITLLFTPSKTVSTQHIHLDHNHCLEIVAVKGRVKKVMKLADSLKAIKGVRHCALSMTGSGEEAIK
jgi:metal-responsive CopG/Arc/MetJ family transcriptional regulator